MQIKEMFKKSITRDIQGVVIAGQGEKTNIATELEEYVVTPELQRHFADFFSAYAKGINGDTTKMGVWISGFFGSGKSHLLKILSYVLDNELVGGKRAIDYFIDDKKITDPMVLADMQLAANTPSDIIIFNIDAKSESDGKSNKDAIVNVFLKVFNNSLGFCGAIPYLADLERKLTEDGKYEQFKETYQRMTGHDWYEERHEFLSRQDGVVDTLIEMGYMSEKAAWNWCDAAIGEYQISIEDFAKRVKSYIDRQGNNHHVVFLVDEIGQYIGDDSKLMLNLQTVTEELGKECKGKAWVIVTSQQDIDSITKVKGNDFSKIQGRFDTRLSLSSANVDTVIKKRILDKTDTAAQTLRLLYEQKATIIKNLIVFNDGVEKKLYANDRDFAEVYPFIPYQFNLLASVLTSIRTHGASGKHLSEGERSMLALFKESAMALKDENVGAIVPFHRFYDALENFLDHSHKGVIIRAYDNSYINPDHKDSNVFAINVLKTLFMVKYVLEIESNIDNITSLMIENIDDDRIDVKERVEEALKVLTRQMLVQKNGSHYVFLTDEEQEINREIDSQNVEMAEVINKVSEMIFEDIFTDKNNLRDVNLDFPLITGSDCHDWEVYPYHDKNTIGKTRNFTQFKCLPTFRGLLLSITSFSTRVNRSENDNLNYVKSISLDGIEYPLANGINAIIGDNGAGKSLLLNVIAGKDVSYYKKFVKINHISRNIVGEGFQDGKIAFIEQGSIAKEVREGDLFRNSNNYGPIPTLESFSKAINNYFDELIAYIQLNIKKKAALNNLKELNLKVQVVNENFYHPIFQHDLKFIDNQEKTARKSAILDIYRRYKNEYDGNIAYYKEHGLSDRIEKNLSDLRAIVYDVCLISNSAEFEEKIKGTIDSSIRSIELDYNNRRTSEETGRKAVIDKRNKFIHAIIECVETQNEYKPFPHFPKKMPGISENPKGGYRFVKKAAYHNVDLKNDFYNYCFNNAYSNEEAIKKIETIDELTSALSKYNASELPAFKKGKVGKFIEDYSKETTSISEISGDETIGNTPGEISLVYYKFKIEETSNEFDIIAIDQPEDDINPVKINSYLLKYLGSIRENKQIVIVTHNPLLVVNLDVDNVIYVQKNRDKLTVYSGALEYQCQEYSILDLVKQNLDGGYDAVERRLKIYERDNYQF